MGGGVDFVTYPLVPSTKWNAQWITMPTDPFQKLPLDSFKTNDRCNTCRMNIGLLMDWSTTVTLGEGDWTRDLSGVNHISCMPSLLPSRGKILSSWLSRKQSPLAG
ncbi:hypothetical protein HNY73_016534 [Argiope bruennichi]|uniref:Uncharacterized protein n=1 Tax=Argiope bruennichi TaxID=94029 RepID=A0A8T0EK04_ARGBR|nr:hypothetical protein HNY73_016534 [Argiope bruennichi]